MACCGSNYCNCGDPYTLDIARSAPGAIGDPGEPDPSTDWVMLHTSAPNSEAFLTGSTRTTMINYSIPIGYMNAAGDQLRVIAHFSTNDALHRLWGDARIEVGGSIMQTNLFNLPADLPFPNLFGSSGGTGYWTIETIISRVSSRTVAVDFVSRHRYDVKRFTMPDRSTNTGHLVVPDMDVSPLGVAVTAEINNMTVVQVPARFEVKLVLSRFSVEHKNKT